MNISLHHFTLVDTIVKKGTLTRAAASLHLTQSALSHQLKELERELGTAVFTRGGKKLQLSGEGKRFLQTAQVILAELQLLENDLGSLGKGTTGKLTISTQCYTAYHWLPGIIKNFKGTSPGTVIHILSEATYNPLEFLLRGELDVGIVKTRIDDPAIQYKPIFEDELMVIMSKDHPLAKKQMIKIRDFHNQELILSSYSNSDKDTMLIESLLQSEQVSPTTVHRILYTDAIIEMVAAGLAISVMANWIIQPYLASRSIVARPLPSSIARRTWYAATTRQSVPIANFLHCLSEHFGGIDRLPIKYSQAERSLAVV